MMLFLATFTAIICASAAAFDFVTGVPWSFAGHALLSWYFCACVVEKRGGSAWFGPAYRHVWIFGGRYAGKRFRILRRCADPGAIHVEFQDGGKAVIDMTEVSVVEEARTP